MAKKPSLGRQKIKIVKIERKNNLQVTFSKRRSGLFKKASELCTLCGVEIAIIVFSPAGKVFSFGHPNVESIIDRFFTRTPSLNSSSTLHLVEVHRNTSVRGLNFQLTHILHELESQRQGGETLDHLRKACQDQFWWESPIDQLSLHELEQLKNSMEELKKNVTNQAIKILVENMNSLPFFSDNTFKGIDQFETKPIEMNVVPNNFGYGNAVFF